MQFAACMDPSSLLSLMQVKHHDHELHCLYKMNQYGLN